MRTGPLLKHSKPFSNVSQGFPHAATKKATCWVFGVRDSPAVRFKLSIFAGALDTRAGTC